MNDADRKAFETALVNRCKSVVTTPQDFEAGFRAACEWRNSQAGEPRYWVHNFGDEDGGEEFFDHPTGSDCPDCVPLYLAPPTAQINQPLVDFVQNWLNLQGNDDNYMTAKAKAALAAAKETK